MIEKFGKQDPLMEMGVVLERTVEKLVMVMVGICGRDESLMKIRGLSIRSSKDQRRYAGDSITLLMGMGSFGKLSISLECRHLKYSLSFRY